MSTQTKKRGRLLDFLVVTALIILASVITATYRPDTLIAVLLFLAAPSLFLCLREKKNYKKIVWASIAFGVLAGMSYNFVAEFNNAYATHYGNVFLNYHLIGKTPIGDFIWAFLIPFFTITFYEHFIDDEHNYRVSKHYKETLVVAGFLFLIPIFLLSIKSSLFQIKYAYLVLGLLSALPLIYLIRAQSQLTRKILVAGIFFIFVNLLFEVVALYAGLWAFPGTYVGWISLGTITIPLEELLFWIIPSSAVFLVCYELCFDDTK